MSRCGYSEDFDDNWSLIKWRGQVASAIRGKRGQEFLLELRDALEAMPEKRLIAHELQAAGQVCALGSVGARRGIEMGKLDPYDYDTLSGVFGIAHQLVQEIEWVNDQGAVYDTPEKRWQRVHDWAVRHLKAAASSGLPPVEGA